MLRNQNLQVANSLSAAARSAAATINGTGVDLAACDAATVAFQFGTWTDGTHTPKIQESNDNSSFTDVAAGDQIGTLSAVSGAGGSNTTQVVGYKGAMRYIRAVLTTAAATTGALSAATVIRGHNYASDG